MPLKASGMDRFPMLFYQRYEHIIGPQISNYCISILNDEIALDEINNPKDRKTKKHFTL